MTMVERVDYIKEAFPSMSDEEKLNVTLFLITEKINDDVDCHRDC